MGKRIMVVDDSRMVQLQMKRLLEDTDYEIAGFCSDGAEAIDQYDELEPDLTTMDIIMPGVDGLEAARTILEEHPEANIVMLSSLAYEESINESKEIGAKGFIHKPFDREQVLKVLDYVLQKQE